MSLTIAPERAPASLQPLVGVYRPAAPIFVAGHGCTLVDEEGREFLDFTAGIGVNALGYGDAGLAQALAGALATGVIHTSNLFRTAPAVQLAATLVKHSFADQVFFCNSGGEANEGALKFARRWAREVGGEAKHEFVALRGSFHGRLFGSLAVTDRASFQAPFTPLMPGTRFVDASDVDSLRAALDPARTAAIIAEPIQGEGGVYPLPAGVLQALRDAADDANALLIFDEVQCGLGRTGHLFAYEQSGVTPDILTLAKPLAGGLPMGAVLVTERVGSVLRPGDHATTFGGGPLVSSVALHVVRRIAEPAFLARVTALGALVADAFAVWLREGVVRDARGAGLMWGIELDGPAAPVVARALEAGLLVLTAGEKVLRLLPPLVITEAELQRGLGLLREVL